MAEMAVRDCSTPFTEKVYNGCGDDIGDLLTLLYVQANSEDHSMLAVFFSARILEERELAVLERVVRKSAPGIDIRTEVHFRPSHPFDIKDGIMLYLKKERPLYAMALSAAQWKAEGEELNICLPDSANMDMREAEECIRETGRRIFGGDFNYKVTLTENAGAHPESAE